MGPVGSRALSHIPALNKYKFVCGKLYSPSKQHQLARFRAGLWTNGVARNPRLMITPVHVIRTQPSLAVFFATRDADAARMFVRYRVLRYAKYNVMALY